jgi:hemerythrin-like domain-containing protein
MLSQEHAVILQQLENLDRARRALEAGGRPPVEFFEAALAFAREFADRFHHFKEEFLLFGLLARSRGGSLDAEIGALRFQHERCRQAIEEIARALPGYAGGDEFAATAVAFAAAGYTTLLRRHIHLEEQRFFPLASEALTEEEDAELVGHFREEETGRAGGREALADYRDRAAAMAALLKPPGPG